MTRPVRNLAQPPGQRSWTPPDWDPQAIAADYLLELKEAAARGPLDPDWVNYLNSYLVYELRTAYSPEAVERAVARLEPMIARLEQKGAAVAQGHAAPPPSPPQPAPNVVQRVVGSAGLAPPVQAAGFAATPAVPPRETLQTSPHLDVATPLDGARLQTSVLPTWLALVALTWVSLLWGGLISAPFGVGAVLLGGSVAGAIAVPMWASIFGFFGMSRARDATLAEMKFKTCPPDHPLTEAAQVFARELSIPAPKVGVINVHNAFAMGGSPADATVAMGMPLLQSLTEEEALAVLGHEMGHVVSGDMRRMTLMRTFQNATVWFMFAQGAKQFARWVICWGAELYILAFSRKREYWADAIGAALTSKEAMIGALQKLAEAPALSDTEATHARFMVRGRFLDTFSTHPSFEDRIVALQHDTYMRQLPRRSPR